MNNEGALPGEWRLRALACVVTLGVAAPVASQTLDEQYEFYLNSNTERCQNMGFERDSEEILVPGQAGPQLNAYCSGPVSVGGGSSPPAASGGAAGAASGQGQGEAADATLRKRREQVREASDQQAPDDATTLISMGRFSAFFSIDLQRERQKQTHYEAGQRSDLAGLLLGADYRFGATGVAGMALKLNQQSGDFDNEGGDFRVRSAGAVIYGSWFPWENLFVDATVGMDRRQLQVRRVVTIRKETFGSPGGPPIVFFDPPPAPVDSDPDGSEWGAELRAGYDFPVGGMTVGPRAGITTHETQTDAFTETGSTPMTLAFDAQTEKSLRSALGMQISKAFNGAGSVVVSQFNLDWVHEFSDDQRVITAHFSEDLRRNPSQLRFLDQPPDRDVGVARLSISAVFAHGFSAFGNVESLFGHDYIDRYGAAVGVRREF